MTTRVSIRADRRRARYNPRVRACVAALALTAAAAGACDPSAGDGDRSHARGRSYRDPGTLIVGRVADAISLDPGRITDNESVEVVELVYDKLIQYGPGSNEIQPGLASSWQVSDDGRVWTFQLRRGVKFHDGAPLNADAVVFSWERQRDLRHPAHRDDATGAPFVYWDNTYRNIRTVEAVDSHTVRVTIERPYAPFEADLAMFPVAIVSPRAVLTYGADYYRHPVGTGPFRFVSWADGRIVLERNPHYWGGAPHVERLVFKAMPDARQRLVALESGAIDIAYSISPEELQFVALHPQLRLYQAPANNVSYLALNTARPPFDDVRVRRAANLAINKEPIVKLAYQGMAIVAHGALPPTQWAHHAPTARYGYDPVKARSLLAEAQREGRFDPARVHDFYVSLTPRPYLPDPELVARVLQANLAEVGLRTRLIVQPFADHLTSVQQGDHDLCLLGWVGDNGDPDNYLYVLFGSDNTMPGTARNVAFFRDAVIQDLLVAGQTTQQRDQRAAIYRQVQERLGLEAPWVPLAHSQVAIAARSDVQGIMLGPSTHVAFRHVRRDGE